MSIPEGTHKIGPSNGSLKVKTGKEGAAAKTGHDLVLVVNSWEATVEGGDSPSIKLTADPGSVEVVSGAGGAKPLGDKDKADIKKSINGKVLGSSQISFTSSEVDGQRQRQGRPLDRRLEQLGRVPISVSGDKISGSPRSARTTSASSSSRP